MKGRSEFFAAPFWGTVPGFLLHNLVFAPLALVVIFPIYCTVVLYLSIRSLTKWENIE